MFLLNKKNTMIKLSKQQISAVAEEIQSKINLQIEAEHNKIEKSAEFKKCQNDIVKKYADVLVFLKKWSESKIRIEAITGRYSTMDYEEFLKTIKEKSVEHLYTFKTPSPSQIERQVVLNTIDAVSVEELINKISAKYEITSK